MPHLSRCKLLKYLKIVPANRRLYHELSRFHYREAKLGPVTDMFAIMDEHPQRKSMVPAVGIIVYRPAFPNLAIRNRVTGDFFGGLDRVSSLNLLNAHVQCISRVIIEPRYRGLGLSSWIIRETLPKTNASMVEASSVMGQFHPFLERAGMRVFSPPQDVKTERMNAAMESVGLDGNLWIDAAKMHAMIDQLPTPQRAFITQEIDRFMEKFSSRRHMPHSLERTDYLLSKLGGAGKYYVWLNPDKPVAGLELVPTDNQ